MESNIQAFYKNKTVFLTGASGFLGRVIIEKLLRTTEVKRIYVLIRPKRGLEIQDRITAWDKDPLFGILVNLNPKFFERIHAIAGDCQEPDLGISESDRMLLFKEVQVVVHSAATVNFDEPLNVALAINTRATLTMLHLAKQMRYLESYVHVSTAFSNCIIHNINEIYYPEHLSCTYDKVLAMSEQLSIKLINDMTPALLGKFPNTYTYTKALAEQVVQMEAGDLPVCIFRPGMILPTYKEPLAGWIDNLYGPISVLYGSAFGVLRIFLLDKTARSNIVPVDYCVNIILASAWQTSVQAAERKKVGLLKAPSPAAPIYNFVPTEQNSIKWADFVDVIDRLKFQYPLEQMIWYPFMDATTTFWLYNLAIYFYHLLPGLFIDMGLRLRGQKPRMLKIYDKIHKNTKRLAPFSTQNWSFEMDNTNRLEKCLSPTDRKLFEFDMNAIDWNDYMCAAVRGMREYLGKEKPTEESLNRANKLLKRFLMYHRLLQLTVFCLLGAFMRWIVKLVIS